MNKTKHKVDQPSELQFEEIQAVCNTPAPQLYDATKYKSTFCITDNLTNKPAVRIIKS